MAARVRRIKGPVSLGLVCLMLLPVWRARAGDDPGKQRTGTLAVVNAGNGGSETVARVSQALSSYVGGWSGQPGVAAYLEGRPSPGALPMGQIGQGLVRLSERVRSESRASSQDLTDLGRLLGVDYLALVRVRGRSYVVRLYSVRSASYAPGTFEGRTAGELSTKGLKEYVVQQTRAGGKVIVNRPRWWIWAAAAGVAALTLTLVLTTGRDSSGDLRIRVTR